MQHVAHTQRASRMAAKSAKGKSGFGAQIVRYIETTGNSEIGAQSRSGNATEFQHGAGPDRMRLPKGERLAVECCNHRRTGQRNDSIRMELQRRTRGRAFQRRRTLIVSEQTI